MGEPRLKPCPFCGEIGQYGRSGETWQSNRMWFAGCPHGHARSPDLDSIEDAAAWWNRRYRKRLTPPPADTGAE